jgi:hypothetical protein
MFNLMDTTDLQEACKIWGFRGGDYEECRLIGRGVVWLL